MVVGAVVVVVALVPVVIPALMSIGGVSAGAGKLPSKGDQLVKDHLNSRFIGTMVAAKVGAAGSAFAASVLAAIAAKRSKILIRTVRA